MTSVFITVGVMSGQSYFDDDIYYDASKAKKAEKQSKNKSSQQKQAVVVYDYPSSDNYTVNGTRSISVDEYNRRGIFAIDSLSTDTTATDFTYTRKIEQFYNPQIVSESGDKDLAQIYYMEPELVNIYINTPSNYWGYDYFYPYNTWYSPYWYNNYWRWNSSFYWGSWYDPYWDLAYGWSPGWGWNHGWGWNYGWGPSWGWTVGGGGHHHYNPRHPGAFGNRPNGFGSQATSIRPSLNGGRHNGSNRDFVTNRPVNNNRPGYNNSGTSTRPSLNNSGTNRHNDNSTTRHPNNNNSNRWNDDSNNSFNRQNSNNGGRFNSGSGFGGGSRNGFGNSGGGGRHSGGGRGRH